MFLFRFFYADATERVPPLNSSTTQPLNVFLFLLRHIDLEKLANRRHVLADLVVSLLLSLQ